MGGRRGGRCSEGRRKECWRYQLRVVFSKRAAAIFPPGRCYFYARGCERALCHSWKQRVRASFHPFEVDTVSGCEGYSELFVSRSPCTICRRDGCIHWQERGTILIDKTVLCPVAIFEQFLSGTHSAVSSPSMHADHLRHLLPRPRTSALLLPPSAANHVGSIRKIPSNRTQGPRLVNKLSQGGSPAALPTQRFGPGRCRWAGDGVQRHDCLSPATL